MNRKELQSYINSKLYLINNSKDIDTIKVSEILKNIGNEYSKIEVEEFDDELRSRLFEATKPITEKAILFDLEQLNIKNSKFIKDNYYQIRLSLKSLMDSLD